MRKWTIFLLLALTVYACSRVPITGRKQVKLLPESMVLDMSFSEYNSFLASNAVVTGTPEAQLVKEVGNNIADATEQYLRRHNNYQRIADFKWEFNLVKNEAANAWAMPGGKVVFYTGILPYTQDAGGMATVMGHEIAHAVARHGNERMSQQLATQLGGLALDVALAERSAETRQLFMTAYGLGTTVGVLLPYSRLHESEADKMGMIFMAIAGYNPEEAIDFWQRMSQAGGAQPPEFLSTHPSHDTRIQNLRDFLPEAMTYYNERITQN